MALYALKINKIILDHMRKIIVFFILTVFLSTSLSFPALAQEGTYLPKPGVMVHLSQSFTPAIIRGMVIDAKNPFAFNFLIDRGDNPIAQNEKKEQYAKLIKYFLAAMTIAEDKQWVTY